MVNDQFPWLTPFSQQDTPGFAWRTEDAKDAKRAHRCSLFAFPLRALRVFAVQNQPCTIAGAQQLLAVARLTQLGRRCYHSPDGRNVGELPPRAAGAEAMKRRGRGQMKTAPSPRRDAVVHRNLVLIRVPDPGLLDKLLSRADLRQRCLVRLGPDQALFARAALVALRRRLAELDHPVVERAATGGEPE
jgi:hypothetical protein